MKGTSAFVSDTKNRLCLSGSGLVYKNDGLMDLGECILWGDRKGACWKGMPVWSKQL